MPILALAAAAMIPATASSGERWRVTNERIELRFEERGDRLVLARLGGSGQQFLGAFPRGGDLWRIHLRDGAGKPAAIGSGQLDLARGEVMRDDEGQVARFAWPLLAVAPKAEARVGVRLRPKGALTYWSFEVSGLPAGWTVVQLDFPIIPNLRPGDGLRMVTPTGWGIEWADPGAATDYHGSYPSLMAAMQLLALYRDGVGVYLGAHDPEASLKQFNVGKSGDAGVFPAWIVNWPPEVPPRRGRFALPYPVVVGVFPGGWYDAAQIHRAWTLRTPWGSRRAIARRRTPKWFQDIDLWLMPAPDPVANVDECVQAGEFFGVPIGLHWYRWHEIPFDTRYPEYFPAKPRFAEGVKALQQAGFRVMPYINGRLWDPATDSWKAEHADSAAVRQRDGSFVTEVYGSKVPLNVMCPTTELWQRKVAGLVDRLANECGVDGVYIDQISAAAGIRCYGEGHGHPPGGGEFWSAGYRKLLADIRRRLPAGRMITTEENADPWIDLFDGQLLVNTPLPSGRLVPLFPAVYSGRSNTFGFQYIGYPGDFEPSPLPFRAKMARCFLWGSQLGWVQVGPMLNADYRAEAEFLRDLARCRSHVHPHLARGRLLGEVEVTGDNPTLTVSAVGTRGKYQIELPAVMATAWRADDGTSAAAAVNMSDAEHEVSLALPGATVGRTAYLRIIGPEGDVETTTTRTATYELTMPPRSARAITVSRMPPSGDPGCQNCR
jgi:hypothetical protein